jgi:hypothetical protein
MACHPHTSCQDRDSFMCGHSWKEAASTCSDPCPSGEHSDCPNGMKCFAYTPCNNAGSFYCGTDFDEAGSCDKPCPSGDSKDCPGGLSCYSYTSCGVGGFNPTNAPVPTPAPSAPHNFTIGDSFYCGSSHRNASALCEHRCPSGKSTDCPTGLACFEFTTCVGREEIPTSLGEEIPTSLGEEIPTSPGGDPSSPPTSELDSFYCGKDYADANEKCLVPCPNGTSLECPPEESCIPFTICKKETAPTVDLQTPSVISSTFFCGKNKKEAEASCEHSCPLGPNDCPDDLDCFAFTTCLAAPASPGATPSSPGGTTSSPGAPNADPASFYCGSSFENATSTCSIPCPSGFSSKCPDGQSCYGYTS